MPDDRIYDAVTYSSSALPAKVHIRFSPASVKCTKRGGVKVQHRPLYLLPDNSA